jgi:ATP-dependent helicase/DNAse subunit B
MVKDKFSAVWVSHSSIGDYLKCPRAYYLKNMYRDPKTNHKVMLMQPPLALGQAVHEVVESLSQLPTESRFSESLLTKYDRAWQKISGKFGGFASQSEEDTFKTRGAAMIERIMKNPGPLQNRAIKIRQDLPYFWLSEEDNIILCGKIDWLEYLESSDSVHILDFKTGKFDEDPDSLQLPIYVLLATKCQTRAVTRASYWYLDRDDAPVEVALPDLELAYKRVLDIAKKIQLARKLEHFKCPQNDGCRVCRPYEAIISGTATFVGVGGYSQDIYTVMAGS